MHVQALNKKGGTHTWPVDAQRRRFRMFRILQTGYNSNNHFYLALSGSEFYGRLFDGVAAPDEDKFAVCNIVRALSACVCSSRLLTRACWCPGGEACGGELQPLLRLRYGRHAVLPGH